VTPEQKRRVLLVHAHPDDESITTGGTIARYAAEGADITLVTCTLGEEGEIIPPEFDGLGSWAGDQLGGFRHGELTEACRALGVTTHRYLGGVGRWRDSGMAGADRLHPRALVRGSLEEQADQLAAVLEEIAPQVVVTYDALGGYGHPDHIRAHEITMLAAPRARSVRRIFHTVSSAGETARGLAALRARPGVPFRIPEDGELPAVADTDITTVVDIAGWVDAKLAALRAHRTQVSVAASGECFALSNGIAQPVPGTEHYVLAHGPAEGAATDLFGGL
jgi:N-acetyl-1-D-myo-inositol-2-amino-2-deoxy-alpha-D-glucopyranoside deacetylase